MALAVAGCGSSSKSSSSTTAKSGGNTSGNTASDTGITPTTIKLGYISSLTGNSSSTFADGPEGALARIDAQNAAGGIDGRKIVMVTDDDQSSPAGDETASQDMATNKGVFGVIDYSAYTFGGAKVLAQAGVPVTGWAFDGPEWGQAGYSNMFGYLPPISTVWPGNKYEYYNYTGDFLKTIGKTKVAGLAYGVSPSSQASIKAIFAGGSESGATNCYANYSVPFGGVDFTADVLSIKKAGCNAVAGSFVDSSDEALSTALNQGGVNNAAEVFFTGYDQTTLDSPEAKAAFNGDYFENVILFDRSNPAVATMLDNLAKYDPKFKAGTLPDYGMWGSYISADLMIKGLEMAGKNPTRKSFMSALRTVTNYTAGGMLPGPTPLNNFGTTAMLPSTGCMNFVQLKNGQFINADPGGKPVCSSLVSFSAS